MTGRRRGGGVSEHAVTGSPSPESHRNEMKAIILCIAVVLYACGVDRPVTTATTQDVRCNPGQCDDGNGGGDGWNVAAAQAYITSWSTTNYGNSPKWGLSCDISSDGSHIDSCSVYVQFGAQQVLVDCTYPADGSSPLCLTIVVNPPE